MSQSQSRSKLYQEVLIKKKILKAHKEKEFNIEFPKFAFDRICKFYGHEILSPNSFVIYHTMSETTEVKKLNSVSHQVGDKEVNNILDNLNNFIIMPISFEEYDEVKKMELAPKINNKMLRNIVKKAGIAWDFILDYIVIQEVTTEVHETSHITITYQMVDNIFQLIPLLDFNSLNGEKIQFTYYSLKSILEKSGIKLEKMLPFLKHEIKEIDRVKLLSGEIPLYEKVKIRELKDRIKKGDLKEKSLDINLGAEPLERFNQIPLDFFKKEEEEERELLKDLLEKIEKKKNKIKKYYEDNDNQIIEIKDINNKIVYIRKKIFDDIISDPEEEFDEFQTYDIDENEITVSKKELTNYQENPTLIKIYNKNNNKEEFIFAEMQEIEEILKDFTYIKEQKTFKGKNKNEEPKEEDWLVMDVECDEDLPKLDDSKPLYTIPAKEKQFEQTKKDLLNEIKKEDNNDNKDVLLYRIKNKFIPINLINEIKENVRKVKNKNIKFTIKDILNKDETITLEYKDIFEEDYSEEYVLLKDPDNEEENIVVNKSEYYNILNSWDDPDSNIKIKNELDNNEKEINPKKVRVKFIKLTNDDIPKNYENESEEVIKKITQKNIIIKSNDNFIKKEVAQKIIDNKEDDYDTYYVKNIKNKNIKISKKQLEKDIEDESCQFISILTDEEPDKDVIVSYKEMVTQLESDPMDESISVNDIDGKTYKIKKTSVKVKPLEIKDDDINLEEQPRKIKNKIIKDIKDYYYLYKEPENNKPHYVRGDVLKLIKSYNSQNPIENFEIEDYKEEKFLMPKNVAIKMIDDPNEEKYICLEDEDSKDEPIMAEYTMLEKAEGNSDEPIQVNKEGQKIKLKKVKVKHIKLNVSLGEQPEEKNYEIINELYKILEKNNPTSNIYQVKDSNNNDIFIYEETLNKIEENKADPEKTTYKGKSPLKEEIICGKNIKRTPNKFIKLVEPNNIVDKNEFEKSLKEFKISQKTIKIKDIKDSPIEFDPLKVKIYEATPEETEITKILPADFTDINQKLLLDITPQNKLILTKDINNQNCLINKTEGDNLIKYPKTAFDTFTLYDKDGKKIKVSRKKVEEDVNNNNCEYIEILNNTNDKNEDEILPVSELYVILNDKENEDFEIKNKDGKKIKLNKKKITIRKQSNKHIVIPMQNEEIKNKLLSDIKDSYIKIKDSKNNRDTIIRYSQLEQINNHEQKAPFINYEILNNKKEKVYTTKNICKQILSNPNNDKEKLILCYDETKKDKVFLIPLEKLKNLKIDGDDEYEIGNNQKVIFKNIRIKELEETPKLGEQPEEEKMVKVINLINKINSGALNKSYKTKDTNGKECFVSNNYINKLQTESNNDENDTKYNINDAFGKNKVTLIKTTVQKDNKPGDFVLITNKKDNQDYLVNLNDLLNNLKRFKSTDDEIILANAVDNKNMKFNPLDIEIVPPHNNYPFQKIISKKIAPLRIDDVKSEADEDEKKGKKEEDNEKEKEETKQRIRLRSAPARQHIPEKKSYKIRRAIIYKKQRK